MADEAELADERHTSLMCLPLPVSQIKCRTPLYEWKKNGREMMNLPEVFSHTGRSEGRLASMMRRLQRRHTVNGGDDMCRVDSGEDWVEQVGHGADI